MTDCRVGGQVGGLLPALIVALCGCGQSHQGAGDEAQGALVQATAVPTATLTNDGPVGEGTPATVSLIDAVDPLGATSAGLHYAFSCNGSSLEAATYGDSGSDPTTTCTFDERGSYSVRARVIDEKDAFSEYTTIVVVTDIAPTAMISNDGPIPEGGSAVVGFANAFDPSPTDTAAGFHYAFACEGGSLAAATYATTDGAPTISCAFSDNGVYQVSGRIIDQDDAATDYTTEVVVTNVPPVASLGNDGPIDEGGAVTVGFTAASDPSAADAAAGFHYAFACDGGPLPSVSYAAASASPTTNCTFDQSGTFSVLGRIIDKDGGFSEYATTVVVATVAPSATFSNDGPIAEGSHATVSFVAVSDPSPTETAAGFHFAFACDGGPLGGVTYETAGSASTTTCAFADNGVYTVRGRVIDLDGASSEYTTQVIVANVAPTAVLTNAGPIAEGGTVAVVLSGATDPSTLDVAAGFRFAFACDGGSLSTANYATAGTTPMTGCRFDDSGSFTVRARILDKDNGASEYTTTVVVNPLPPSGRPHHRHCAPGRHFDVRRCHR